MKIRTDFVTNSSSSSFILARKDNLTEEQKDAIVDFVLKNMLGKKIASTKEELDEYFLDRDGDFKDYDISFLDNEEKNKEFEDREGYYNFKDYKDCLKAISEGYTIYGGWINWECGDVGADLYEGIWQSLKKVGDSNFIGINTDLSY